ncbi:MAG TPA: hypothetical protein VKB47_12110 [Terracidiphilus sp.]|nr:hypothetical protein [Terracidiphilus sp.]
MKTTLKPTIFLPIAAVLTLGVAAVCAQDSVGVKMTFSGTSGSSANNLQQPNTTMDEDNFAGTGTLGSFTLRNLRAISNSPSPSATCAGTTEIYFLEQAGGGVFRFQDGSLLNLQLTQGSGDCIDLSSGQANCTLKFQVISGTGRFKSVTGGTLVLTEAVATVISDASGNPVYFADTGEITGTVSGVTGWQAQGGQ